MVTNLPTKLKVASGLFVFVGTLYLFDWIEGSYSEKSYLVFGSAHIALALGLLARINAARIASIIASIGGVLVSLLVAAFGGIMGFAFNRSDEATASSLSGGEMNEVQANVTSQIMSFFQTVPWLIVLVGIVFMAIYFWVFLYLTNDEAVGQFRKGKSADT